MSDIISISEKARDILIYKMKDRTHIKLSIKSTGCSGNSYKMEFISPEKIHKFDEIVKLSESRNLVIDSASILKIIGTELNWVENGLESKFDFKNPKAESYCGCGTSFALKDE